MRLGNLRAVRKQAMLTQAELAQKAGLAKETLNRLEQGHQEPRYGTVRKLARALRVKPGALMTEEESEMAMSRDA